MSQEWLDGARGCLIDSPVQTRRRRYDSSRGALFIHLVSYLDKKSEAGGRVSFALFVSVPRPEDYSAGAFF